MNETDIDSTPILQTDEYTGFPKNMESTEVWDKFVPLTRKDLNKVSKRVLASGSELQSDHPGFQDTEYRKQRAKFVKISTAYSYPDPIPLFKYSDIENKTWTVVMNHLVDLFPKYAFSGFNKAIAALKYQPKEVPQLSQVSEWLGKTTGFNLIPTGGLLSSRDFLSSLAFRVFQSTSYIRHGKKPLYTPEPDIVHEIIGHVPMLGDPLFAVFSQEIGLCSLGLSDADIVRLARVYWYTIEFGLIKEDGKFKAIGAGLLSSYGELEHSCTGGPKIERFDPFVCAELSFPITCYQPTVYYVESIEELITKFAKFANSLTPVVKVDIQAIRQRYSHHYKQFPNIVKLFELKEEPSVSELVKNATATVSTK